jgi:hypothetical protein
VARRRKGKKKNEKERRHCLIRTDRPMKAEREVEDEEEKVSRKQGTGSVLTPYALRLS